MFGPDDAFLTTILKLLHWLPIYPMFGRGLMRLQPAYVEDVVRASILTRNFSKSSRTKLALSLYWFQSRLPHGTHWHGSPRCPRIHPSLVIKSN
jgi:hypothetical protein